METVKGPQCNGKSMKDRVGTCVTYSVDMDISQFHSSCKPHGWAVNKHDHVKGYNPSSEMKRQGESGGVVCLYA